MSTAANEINQNIKFVYIRYLILYSYLYYNIIYSVI